MTDRGRVTVGIGGGLGNQLFQYATARRLALTNGVPLVIDHLSGFARDFYQRRYLLDRFAIHGQTIDPRASFVSPWGRVRRRALTWRNRSRALADQTYVVEDQEKFHPEMLTLAVTRPIYLEGYWQHERYFADIADLVRDELTLKTEHDAQNLAMAEKIDAVESVCLHVRRLHGVPGTKDAKPLAQVSAWHHLDASYFPRALELLASKVANPHFFVFADYPDWAREHIHTTHPIEFVTHNGPDADTEDFWLMGRCRHFIISNSTFSWWAAWLARNPLKVVIAPKGAIGKMLRSVPDSWLLV
jgi:Glycosyl transferase family 11